MASNPMSREEDDAVLQRYPRRFVVLMILLALVATTLQVVLSVTILEGGWFSGQGAISPFRGGTTNSILMNCSAIRGNELWVSVSLDPLAYPRSTAAMLPKSRLVAIDLKNGDVRETAITLTPAPRGLIVVNDQLWCVSNTVVYQIVDQQAISRKPRRVLNQPSNPFVHEGQVAVIDHTTNDQYELLQFVNNDWSHVGFVAVPQSTAPAAPWSFPDLRVLQTEKSIFLFYSSGSTVTFREGISLTAAPVPASGLLPENLAERWTGRGFAQESVDGSTWDLIPGISNWVTAWEVLEVNGALRIFYNSSNSVANPIQQLELRGQQWINVAASYPPVAVSFSVTGGTPGYLVTDDLRLFQLNGSTLQRMTKGPLISERFRAVQQIIGFSLSYLLATAVLFVGAWRLMLRYRNPRYLYGKRTVQQASLVRRGIARGIDSLISLFPACFWFSNIWDLESRMQQQSGLPGVQNALLWTIFSTFGMWFGSVAVISFMQGRFGFTPGKWFCGIRTLGTTLRPCGLLRSLAREFVVYADSVFFLTWVPGVLLIALTPHWQRLGDLAADTVVVTSASCGRVRGQTHFHG